MVESGILWGKVGDMFTGEYQHNLDTKGRIIIPSKFRDELNTSFILTKGYDGCLSIYSLLQWEKIKEQIDLLPTSKMAVRKYIRTLMSITSECSLDNQGRIQIPSYLAKPANLTKECVVVGVNDHIEIWDKKAWEEYFDDASSSFEEIAENLSELGNV